MPDTDTESKSKSQKKREHHVLQGLAKSLIGFTAGELAAVPMSDILRQSVIDGSTMKKGALSRHIRYLARILSEEDADAVLEAVQRLRFGSREDTARLHRIERWREELIDDELRALPAFIESHPNADRQRLRQLVRAVRQERERDAPPRAFRRLFALIRELEP